MRSNISALLCEETQRIAQSRLGNTTLGKALKDIISPLVTFPLVEKLDKFILEEGRSVILPMIEGEMNELTSLPISELTGNIFPEPDVLHDFACQLHRRFMGKYVRHLVESIDVGGMITEKVITMSAEEIETLVVSVVKRALNYNVILGGLIGIIIGIITIFV